MDGRVRDEYWKVAARDFLSMYNSGSAETASSLSCSRSSCYTLSYIFADKET